MDVEWSRLKAEELNRRAAEGAIVLLPVASTEQHGPHLATGVDVYLCGEVCRRAAVALNRRGVPAVVAPVLWPGLAEHHVAFGGSFTLTLATWTAVVTELVRSILNAGFARIVIVNGHGGNIAALAAISVELTRTLNAPVASTSYFVLAEEAFAAILEDQRSVLHACEAETSMMMALHPDLVDRSRLAEAVGPIPSSTAGALGAPLMRWKSFRETTPTGVFGDARRASADKGERLFAAAAEALASRLAAGEPWA